jgi:hypothetical protein
MPYKKGPNSFPGIEELLTAASLNYRLAFAPAIERLLAKAFGVEH